MRGETWPAEQIKLLQRLWAAGETAVVIGERLGGRSRSAVLGKVFRLRLDAASVGGSKIVAVTCGQHSATPSRRRRQRAKPPVASRPLTLHKSLLELTNATCRWPHGRPGARNFFFCGIPEANLEEGIPYCAKHMRRAYTPAVSFDTARPRTQPHARAAGQ